MAVTIEASRKRTKKNASEVAKNIRGSRTDYRFSADSLLAPPRITLPSDKELRLRVASSSGFRKDKRTRPPGSAAAKTSTSEGFASRVTTGRLWPCELCSGWGVTERTV